MTKKGPWNEEEDSRLVHYININGEGRWDSLARAAGLERTGKSCRLRWLNYLRPGIRHGNLTTREQLMILELHFQWGNRWSKIAQHLPGRTDNEIKNYWRTRVEKQAKHLKCGVNSKQFKETMRNVWMPRLAEQVRATTSGLFSTTAEPSTVVADHCADVTINHDHDHAAAATCTSEMAVSSNPRDEWLLDINDPLLNVNGTSQHNYSFCDHDLMLLDNLWN